MKIKVVDQNQNTVRSFNHPKEVIVRSKAKIVEIFDSSDPTQVMETFHLLEKKVEWLEDPDTDCAEVSVELKIQQKVQKPETV